MDGAEPSAGEHCDDRLGHRWHIDHHAVAATDAARLKSAGEARGPFEQFAICEFLDRRGDRAVIDQRGVLGAAAPDMTIECVEAGVQFGAGKPPGEGAFRLVENFVPLPRPVDRLGRPAPKTFGIGKRTSIDIIIVAHLVLLSFPSPALSDPATDYGTMVGIGLWSKRPFEFGEDDEKIADEAIVRHLEDRGLLILVDGDNDLRILHSGEVLDGTRNADSYVQIRCHHLARLTDLPVVGSVASINGGSGGA